jgi:hypothetical protein
MLCLVHRLLFYLFPLVIFAKEPIRTWTSTDGRTLQGQYIESSAGKVTIKMGSREYTLPLSRFSQKDQDYAKKAYGRALFVDPQPFEDQGRGGVIIAAAKGKVEVITQKRDRYSDKDPDPRVVIVGE